MKIRVKTNNLIPNSTNLSQHQHSLPKSVNFNYFIFNSTKLSQYEQSLSVNFNNFILNSTISCQHQRHKLELVLKSTAFSASVFSYMYLY